MNKCMKSIVMILIVSVQASLFCGNYPKAHEVYKKHDKGKLRSFWYDTIEQGEARRKTWQEKVLRTHVEGKSLLEVVFLGDDAPKHVHQEYEWVDRHQDYYVPGRGDYRTDLNGHAIRLKEQWDTRETTVANHESTSRNLWRVSKYALFATLGFAGLCAYSRSNASDFPYREVSGTEILSCVGIPITGLTSLFAALGSWSENNDAARVVPDLKKWGKKNYTCRQEIEKLDTARDAQKSDDFRKQLGLPEEGSYSELFGFSA